MPIIKSAKKRVRVARKAAARNTRTKRSLRHALKAFHAAVTGGKNTTTSHSKAQRALDKAAKKGLLHKNKVARKKRQLAARAKAASGGKKSSVKKSVAKKSAPKKKSPAKKSKAKKSTKRKR